MVASDVRHKEFYRAFYHDGIRVDEPQVSVPGAIPDLPTAGPIPGDPAGSRHLDATVLVVH